MPPLDLDLDRIKSELKAEEGAKSLFIFKECWEAFAAVILFSRYLHNVINLIEKLIETYKLERIILLPTLRGNAKGDVKRFESAVRAKKAIAQGMIRTLSNLPRSRARLETG